MQIDFRKCNPLWFEDPDTFSKEDLLLLQEAFKVGFIPLADRFGEHNPKWIIWKQLVQARIDKELNT